jgi:hypothetical protein
MASVRIAGAVAVALLAAGAVGAAPPAASDSRAEAPLLARFMQVSREGPVLRIDCPGAVVEFRDEPYSRSRLIAAYEIRRGRVDFLVATRYKEGRAFVLVDGSSGAKIELPGEPVLSPRRDRYLSASMDLDARGNPNRFLIVAADGYRIEFEKDYEPASEERPQTGPDSADWLGENEVELVEETLRSRLMPPEIKKLILKKTARGWTPKPAP